MLKSSTHIIINGRKYKKCKENQIRNPKTNRCVNKKSEGNKKCPEGKVLNPKTNRCVNKKSEGNVSKPKTDRCVKGNVSNKCVDIKRENLFKKLFNPFINRVNSNIDDRIKYYNLLNNVLNINETKDNYCMRLYKYNKDGNHMYIIGNKIVLKNRIGTDSSVGVIYMSSIREKYNKIFKYAIKLMIVNNSNKKEIKLLKEVSNEILNKRCPHFPILYSALRCNNFFNFERTSYIKSENEEITKEQIENIKNYPEIIKRNKKKQFYFILNELANGDLKTFIEKYQNDYNLLMNAFIQIYISIMFFYQKTKHFHNDAHWGNFLYHKVKAGGYYHYNIFGEDYYVENLGFLWIIWDYSDAISFKPSIEEMIYIVDDFYRIIHAFLYISDKGWLTEEIKLDKNFEKNIKKINKELFIDTLNIIKFKKYNKYHPNSPTIYYRKYHLFNPSLYNEEYSKPDDYYKYIFYSENNMNTLIKFILNIFKENKIIKTEIKPNSKIINEKPYILKPF
jgi:hypothetical protein